MGTYFFREDQFVVDGESSNSFTLRREAHFIEGDLCKWGGGGIFVFAYPNISLVPFYCSDVWQDQLQSTQMTVSDLTRTFRT